MASKTKSEVEYVQVEVWVAVDECGDYATGRDKEECQERFAEDIGCTQYRMVKVTLNVPKPKPAEIEITVTEEETEVVVAGDCE